MKHLLLVILAVGMITAISAQAKQAEYTKVQNPLFFVETHTPNGNGGTDVNIDIIEEQKIGTANVQGLPKSPAIALIESLLKKTVPHLMEFAKPEDYRKVGIVAKATKAAEAAGEESIEDKVILDLLAKLLEKYPMDNSSTMISTGNLGGETYQVGQAGHITVNRNAPTLVMDGRPGTRRVVVQETRCHQTPALLGFGALGTHHQTPRFRGVRMPCR